MSIDISDLLRRLQIQRKIFVSYHHEFDQNYYNHFSSLFSDTYELLRDNSLDRIIDSYDTQYVLRRIRENHISGSSCTIILCGQETYQRKYVDWEIKATLDKQHGLIGIVLPTIARNHIFQAIVPDRLYDNILSGYAEMINWIDLINNPLLLKTTIEAANNKSKAIITNSPMLKPRNG